MYFGVPIIAYDSTAIGETLGGSGVLLQDKNPQVVAEAINLAATDEKLRAQLIEGESTRLQYYDNRRIKEELLTILKDRLLI